MNEATYATLLIPDCIVRAGIPEIAGHQIRKGDLNRRQFAHITCDKSHNGYLKEVIGRLFAEMQLRQPIEASIQLRDVPGAVPRRERFTAHMPRRRAKTDR